MQLRQGRPPDYTNRPAKEMETYDFLDSLGVDYQSIDHEAAMTMEACAAIDAAMGAEMCKNLLLCNRQCTDFYLLLLPGDKVFKTSVLSKQIGSSRLSFADGSYMEAFLNISPGSLSVLGLRNDTEHKVTLLIDNQLLDAEYIGCHPCVNTASVRLKVTDLLNTVIPAMEHTPTFVILE